MLVALRVEQLILIDALELRLDPVEGQAAPRTATLTLPGALTPTAGPAGRPAESRELATES
mgnify:CR=1 FL=1